VPTSESISAFIVEEVVIRRSALDANWTTSGVWKGSSGVFLEERIPAFIDLDPDDAVMEEVFPYILMKLAVDTHDRSMCLQSFVCGPRVNRVAGSLGCFDRKIWDFSMDTGLKKVLLVPREKVIGAPPLGAVAPRGSHPNVGFSPTSDFSIFLLKVYASRLITQSKCVILLRRST